MRGDLPLHEAQTCSEIPVSCSMAQFGCSWKGPRSAFGLSEYVSGPLEEDAHFLACPFLPLSSYLQTSSQRLHNLEMENAALRREVSGCKAVLEVNEEVLKSCVDALGVWCQHASGERSRPPYPDSRAGERAGASTFSSGPDDHADYRIDWPFMEEFTYAASSRESRPTAPSTSLGNSLSSTSSVWDQPRHPSRLETTINDLINSISTLSTQDTTLTNLLQDSRRESIYASVEVTRLAEEVASLRHGLHNVVRQLQMRQAPWPGGEGGVGTGSGAIGGDAGKPAPAAVMGSSGASSGNSNIEGGGTDSNSKRQLGGLPNGPDAEKGALHHPGRTISSGMLPPLPHGHPLIHLPYYPPHPLHAHPYLPSLPMPMPGVRRFWSGSEPTKL